MSRELRIDSHRNPRVRKALQLRSRRERKQSQRTLIEGVRELQRAVDAGVEIVDLFVFEPAAGSAEPSEMRSLRDAIGPQATILRCAAAVFDKLAVRSAGAVAVGVAKTPQPRLDQLPVPPTPLFAVLEALEKPGNLGAILRSADGAGVDAALAVDTVSDLYSPNCIRASLGAVFSVPVWQGAGDEARQWLCEHGVQVFVARVEAARDIWQVDLTGPAAIVLGSESEGVSSRWEGPAVRLPMVGGVDSLNVSATAAAMFYEARRQRTCQRPGVR